MALLKMDQNRLEVTIQSKGVVRLTIWEEGAPLGSTGFEFNLPADIADALAERLRSDADLARRLPD